MKPLVIFTTFVLTPCMVKGGFALPRFNIPRPGDTRMDLGDSDKHFEEFGEWSQKNTTITPTANIASEGFYVLVASFALFFVILYFINYCKGRCKNRENPSQELSTAALTVVEYPLEENRGERVAGVEVNIDCREYVSRITTNNTGTEQSTDSPFGNSMNNSSENDPDNTNELPSSDEALANKTA